MKHYLIRVNTPLFAAHLLGAWLCRHGVVYGGQQPFADPPDEDNGG
jgi:hypothetical protein